MKSKSARFQNPLLYTILVVTSSDTNTMMT